MKDTSVKDTSVKDTSVKDTSIKSSIKSDTSIDYTKSGLADVIKQFMQNYKLGGEYVYVNAIDLMPSANKTSLTMNYMDFALDDDIAYVFQQDSDIFLTAAARAVYEILRQRFPDYADDIRDKISVRMSNYPNILGVREINSDNSGQFVTIKAMLIRMSAIEAIPVKAVYRCEEGHVFSIQADKNYTMSVPVICENDRCKSRKFELNPKESTFVDYQILQLQELPNELPAGKLPKTLGVFVAGDLVDTARMGDTVEISGMIRPEMSKEIKLGVPVQTYRHRLYANHIRRLSNENDFGGEITSDDKERISKMIKNNNETNATNMIISSFASHIQGHTLIKEALILTMIGANPHILSDGTRIRGDINIFILGDPGTAKSEMGKATYRVAPRSFYTSGRGSSAAGLTAAVVQDKVTQTWMLDPGITALADQGLVIIDEFDKMETKDRAALHEVMEQQQASISKAGITASLNTRTSVVAIANPTYGKYDPYRNLTENVTSIPVPLLTRFDMIFVVRDIPSIERDTKIAKHVMSSHRLEHDRIHTPIDIDDFAKYLRIAKRLKPKISRSAESKIIQYYLNMRRAEDAESGFTITVRQLEGLVRLTIARAKFLLKDTADIHDAERAIHILDEMLKTSGVDVNTGKVDFGVQRGKPASMVSRMNLFRDIMQGIAPQFSDGVSEQEIISEMIKSTKWDDDTARDFLHKMFQENLLYETSPGKFASV